MMMKLKAQFCIGQIIHHKLFDYRGVIIDIDPIFQGSEDWYDVNALSKPPKDKPWYHILVHDGIHRTYVPEQNLKTDESALPVNHPEIESYFESFENGLYLLKRFPN